jgi:glycerol-3-phosphate dehydrogenase
LRAPRAAADASGAAKSTDDLGPAFGDDLTATEVRYLMTTEFARFANLLWHSRLARTVPARHRVGRAAGVAKA